MAKGVKYYLFWLSAPASSFTFTSIIEIVGISLASGVTELVTTITSTVIIITGFIFRATARMWSKCATIYNDKTQKDCRMSKLVVCFNFKIFYLVHYRNTVDIHRVIQSCCDCHHNRCK